MSRGMMPVYLGLGIQTPILLGHVHIDEDPTVMAASVADLLTEEARLLTIAATEGKSPVRGRS